MQGRNARRVGAARSHSWDVGLCDRRLVREIVARHKGGNFVWTSDPDERDALWEARKVRHVAGWAVPADHVCRIHAAFPCAMLRAADRALGSANAERREQGATGPLWQ